MPKIRGIKPDYWTDEDIVELSIPARLLFIGLWSYACDNGHLQDKPRQIKMRILPGDDVNVAELLRELHAVQRIEREDGWITIPNFTKHQKPDRRYFTTCDHPDCEEPEETSSQRESRRVNGGRSTSARRVPTVTTASAHVDGEGDGDKDTCSTADAARTSDDLSTDFAAWYDQYPRHQGRGQALKAYRTARKKTDGATLLTAIASQRDYLTRKGTEYCPLPATWLNGERWADEQDNVRALPGAGDTADWMRRRPSK